MSNPEFAKSTADLLREGGKPNALEGRVLNLRRCGPARMDCAGLSKTMRALLAWIADHGGEIYRFPGGYWTASPFRSERNWGTTSIEALVSRGLLEYTEWRESRACRFPVKARIVGEPIGGET